jgi:hypothetical protein
MYNFLLNMWKLNRLTTSQVDAAVTAGRITSEQGATIKATER